LEIIDLKEFAWEKVHILCFFVKVSNLTDFVHADFKIFFYSNLGSFAKVQLATHVIVKVPVALKMIFKSDIKDPYVAKNLEREYRILSMLSHPNIIQLLEVCNTKSLYILALEYVPGAQTLADVISTYGALSESSVHPLARQMISALCYLHFKNILHRDLKLENILVDKEIRQCKLIDFGLSNFWHQGKEMQTFCGSPEYAAPELFMKESYGPAVDTWSFGVLLFAMTLGHVPFEEMELQKLIGKVLKGLSLTHLQEMKKLSFNCQILIMKCFNLDAWTRITAKEIAASDKWILGKEKVVVELMERDVQQDILHCIANDIKSRLGVQKTASCILEHVSKRPFQTTGGMFNILKIQHLELDKKSKELSQVMFQSQTYNIIDENVQPRLMPQPIVETPPLGSGGVQKLTRIENLPSYNKKHSLPFKYNPTMSEGQTENQIKKIVLLDQPEKLLKKTIPGTTEIGIQKSKYLR
jgi:serine/threonine protein kinase